MEREKIIQFFRVIRKISHSSICITTQKVDLKVQLMELYGFTLAIGVDFSPIST